MKLLRIGDRGPEVKILQSHLHLTDDGIFGPITEEAVREFQRAKGLTVDGVCGPCTWREIMSATGLKKTTRSIREIIVHCTATPEGREVSVEEIRQWHKARGFSDIGYHYLVDLSGNIHEGRPVSLVGAHTTGHNTGSIGVCYVGGLARDGKTPKDTRTPAQKDALISLLRDLKKLYPGAVISGHSDWANKACPCFDAKSEYKNL